MHARLHPPHPTLYSCALCNMFTSPRGPAQRGRARRTGVLLPLAALRPTCTPTPAQETRTGRACPRNPRDLRDLCSRHPYAPARGCRICARPPSPRLPAIWQRCALSFASVWAPLQRRWCCTPIGRALRASLPSCSCRRLPPLSTLASGECLCTMAVQGGWDCARGARRRTSRCPAHPHTPHRPARCLLAQQEDALGE